MYLNRCSPEEKGSLDPQRPVWALDCNQLVVGEVHRWQTTEVLHKSPSVFG